MGDNQFYAKSIIFILLLNFTIAQYPGQVENITGLDTGKVSGTNVSGTEVNGTTSVSDVGGITDSLSTIFTLYTSANAENRILQGIFLIYTIIVVRDIVLDLGWIG